MLEDLKTFFLLSIESFAYNIYSTVHMYVHNIVTETQVRVDPLVHTTCTHVQYIQYLRYTT
jgi:hypothetical protein